MLQRLLLRLLLQQRLLRLRNLLQQRMLCCWKRLRRQRRVQQVLFHRNPQLVWHLMCEHD
jgi:hypothetical protein